MTIQTNILAAYAKRSPAEKRRDTAIWFTCCDDTWRRFEWWAGRDCCPHCGEIVEGGDYPAYLDAESLE